MVMTKSIASSACAQICLVALSLGMAAAAAHAQSRKPTTHELAAIHDCAKKYETNQCGRRRTAMPVQSRCGSMHENA
ncbi:MAG: hypothetical protein ACLP19_04890 [Xanthobacteraceae bacterium]